MSADAGRVAVVTGASSGIGLVTAEVLRDAGVTTIGLARRLQDGRTSRQCDVTDEGAVARVFADIVSAFGQLDILITCAGISRRGHPLGLTALDWDEMLRTNVVGTYLCCKHALPAMRRQRYGRVVNVSSIAGRTYSRSASVAYTASKYAVIGLTRHLAAAFGADGVTVNCVCPSQTGTPMMEVTLGSAEVKALASAHPLGRLAEPIEVAHAIRFLASEAASYINGAVLDVNGGLL